MVVVPASGHRDIARSCALHLRDGQIIILNPGRTGGALEFHQILNREGCTADVIMAEAGTLVFASRSTGPAQARIFRRKWRRMTAIRISMTEDHPGLRRPGSLLVPGRAASPTDHKISHD